MKKPNAARHDPSPDYLRELVRDSRLTQTQAADRIGVSHRMMRYYLAKGAAHRPAPYPVQYALEALARR